MNLLKMKKPEKSGLIFKYLSAQYKCRVHSEVFSQQEKYQTEQDQQKVSGDCKYLLLSG